MKKLPVLLGAVILLAALFGQSFFHKGLDKYEKGQQVVVSVYSDSTNAVKTFNCVITLKEKQRNGKWFLNISGSDGVTDSNLALQFDEDEENPRVLLFYNAPSAEGKRIFVEREGHYRLLDGAATIEYLEHGIEKNSHKWIGTVNNILVEFM